MTRKAADELVVASVCGLLALTDVLVDYDTKIYATDSSMTHGAFAATEFPPETAQTVWSGGDKKGCYIMLDSHASHARQILKSAGVGVDDAPIVEDWGVLQRPSPSCLTS